MHATAPIRRARPSEEGFILVSVMFLLALLIIAMAVAMPRIIADIQRDREVETYHRGMQYRRAVQLYFRKFNRYPPNVEALVKTNNIRFLRKKYVDPITGKDDWKPIMFGQQKTPLAMGFFGQPLGGAGFGGARDGGHRTRRRGNIAHQHPSLDRAGLIPEAAVLTPTATPMIPTMPMRGNPERRPNAGAGQNPGGGQNAGGGQITGASPIGGPAFGGAGIVGLRTRQPQAVHPGLQEKEPLQRVGIHLQPLERHGYGRDAGPSRRNCSRAGSRYRRP